MLLPPLPLLQLLHPHLLPVFFLALCICCRSTDNKHKTQMLTKGQRTAGYLSPCQPRCQLIAADILPVLFKSKQFWCIDLLFFLTKRGNDMEMPPSQASDEHLSVQSSLRAFAQFAWQRSVMFWTQQIFLILLHGRSRFMVKSHTFGCHYVK